MKKRNLTAAVLACALCAIALTGTACAPQPCYTDEAEPAVAVSVVDSKSSEVEIDEVPEDEADDVAAQDADSDQTEVVAPASSKDEASSVDLKPVSQPQVKKPDQSSVAISKQEAWREVAVANYEADPGGDEIPLAIDSIPADSEESTAKANTITINGVEIDYTDSYGTASAPNEGAGIWRGSDSTTDGSYAYFIGHDYTEFGDIANLEQGSTVSVTDSNGDSCDYEVVDSFVVPEGTLWSEVSDRVTGYGESVVMQTCVEDGYLIVVAG